MRSPGINILSHHHLTTDEKRKLVQRFIVIIQSGYHAKHAEKIVGRSKETMKKWAVEFEIEWPKKK
jgi:hypothetical protein